MISALTVAYQFIKLGIEHSKPVTAMKLQKMIYLAHGIYLVEQKEPLIDELIQAWQYGPVIPSVYHTLKYWGNNPITDLDPKIGFIDQKYTTVFISENVKSTINLCWEVSKDMTGAQLSKWSHATGSPWYKTYKSGILNQIIPNEEIKTFFEKTMRSENG
jgi:uncharacterized phage-associated protein